MTPYSGKALTASIIESPQHDFMAIIVSTGLFPAIHPTDHGDIDIPISRFLPSLALAMMVHPWLLPGLWSVLDGKIVFF
jgi:hypothetical protein